MIRAAAALISIVDQVAGSASVTLSGGVGSSAVVTIDDTFFTGQSSWISVVLNRTRLHARVNVKVPISGFSRLCCSFTCEALCKCILTSLAGRIALVAKTTLGVVSRRACIATGVIH